MLRAERLETILNIVNKDKIITLEDIIQQLGISKATARRDIEDLSQKGLLKKTRGGAMSMKHVFLEPAFMEKKSSNMNEKVRIAEAALKYISPHDKIILDSGTTILELAKQIHDVEDLTIVTNDLYIANEISSSPNLSVLFIGGIIRKGFNSTYGYFAETMLESISVNKVFLSADAIHPTLGILSYTTDDVNIKKLYMESAQEVILLCDHSKFDVNAFIRICGLSNISRIIVGKELSEESISKLQKQGILLELV